MKLACYKDSPIYTVESLDTVQTHAGHSIALVKPGEPVICCPEVPKFK